jgi:predicted transcriptional regulator
MGRPKGARNKKPIQREIILDLLKSKSEVYPTEIDEKLQRTNQATCVIGQLRRSGYQIDSERDGENVIAYR